MLGHEGTLDHILGAKILVLRHLRMDDANSLQHTCFKRKFSLDAAKSRDSQSHFSGTMTYALRKTTRPPWLVVEGRVVYSNCTHTQILDPFSSMSTYFRVSITQDFSNQVNCKYVIPMGFCSGIPITRAWKNDTQTPQRTIKFFSFSFQFQQNVRKFCLVFRRFSYQRPNWKFSDFSSAFLCEHPRLASENMDRTTRPSKIEGKSSIFQ